MPNAFRYRYHQGQLYSQVGFGKDTRWVAIRGDVDYLNQRENLTKYETDEGTVFEYVPF